MDFSKCFIFFYKISNFTFFLVGVQKFHTCALFPINITKIGPIENKLWEIQIWISDHFLMTTAFIWWFYTYHLRHHVSMRLRIWHHPLTCQYLSSNKKQIIIEIKRKKHSHGTTRVSIRHQKISESSPPTHLSVL